MIENLVIKKMFNVFINNLLYNLSYYLFNTSNNAKEKMSIKVNVYSWIVLDIVPTKIWHFCNQTVKIDFLLPNSHQLLGINFHLIPLNHLNVIINVLKNLKSVL